MTSVYIEPIQVCFHATLCPSLSLMSSRVILKEDKTIVNIYTSTGECRPTCLVYVIFPHSALHFFFFFFWSSSNTLLEMAQD